MFVVTGGDFLEFLENIRLIRYLIGAKITPQLLFLDMHLLYARLRIKIILEVALFEIYSSKPDFCEQLRLISGDNFPKMAGVGHLKGF